MVANLGEMGLELVLGVHVLPDAASECVVDGVPLVDHGGGTLVEQLLDAVAVVLGCRSLGLRSLDVVVAELGPGFGDGRTVRGTQIKLSLWKIFIFLQFMEFFGISGIL